MCVCFEYQNCVAPTCNTDALKIIFTYSFTHLKRLLCVISSYLHVLPTFLLTLYKLDFFAVLVAAELNSLK